MHNNQQHQPQNRIRRRETVTRNRTEPITTYVDVETKEQLEKDADRAGKSVSTHVHDLIEREQRRDTTDQRLRELNAEERLEGLIADIKDIQARAGVYAVANFELLKQEYPDPLRRQALAAGSRRLRDPGPPAIEPTGEGDDEDESQTDSREQQDRNSDDPTVIDKNYNIFDDLR